MDPYHQELARHALGLPNRRKLSYRNRFVCGPGHDDHEAWMRMVQLGFATRRPGNTLPFGGDDVFYLTHQGAEAAIRNTETLCPDEFPPAPVDA